LPSRQERSAAVLSRLPAAAVATSTSRQASLTSQAAVVSGARSKDSADDAALRQLAAENEKLRAQVVALRDQAAQVEDGWRQARLAAESAASDRDDYKAQVQELHDQLKEVNIMPS
jgi:chromosome segregation ATPase